MNGSLRNINSSNVNEKPKPFSEQKFGESFFENTLEIEEDLNNFSDN